MRQRIEVQTNRKSLLLRLHVRNQIGGVVPRHLGRSHSQRSGTVVILHDQSIDRLGQSALVIISNGHDHDDEGVFLGGLEADAGSGAEEEGAEVEGAAGPVGWDVGDVVFDDVVASLDEGGDGDFWHYDAGSAFVDALGIFIWSKHIHGTVIMCKCLESLKTRLTIMKGCSTNVNIDIGRLNQLRLLPFPIPVNHLQMRLGRAEFKSQFRPRQVSRARCSHFSACGGYR
mmetsp:Transcript_17564/g.31916  ORF Transcript_17564/g.31916 Transcript_17564/m.31916 type:complete len:229 (+) Transcript_17564:465-1151(+)